MYAYSHYDEAKKKHYCLENWEIFYFNNYVFIYE